MKRLPLALYTGIGLALLVAGVFFRTTQNSYSEDTTKAGFLSNLQTVVANKLSNNKTRQGLIEAYCYATARSQGFTDASAKGLYYDPSKSFFLSVLCSKEGSNREVIEQYVSDYDREELDIPGCQWDDDMNSCDFSVFLPALFRAVMNDISKVKLTQLYTYEGGSTEEAIKAFSDTYFGSGETICKSSSITYLNASSSSKESAQCTHPQTRAILEQYLEQSAHLLESVKLIEGEQLLAANAEGCDQPKNFLLCAFQNNSATSRESFHNLIYNELLFYKLFLTLVSERFTNSPDYSSFRVLSSSTTDTNHEVIRLEQEANLSQKAVGTMEKTLQNMQATFPIHIVLLAYYEDVLSFRKSIVQIYTPIHQLYYKLRNVQEKK